MAEMELPDIDLEGRGLAAEVQRLSLLNFGPLSTSPSLLER